jgi:hypothetical protein
LPDRCRVRHRAMYRAPAGVVALHAGRRLISARRIWIPWARFTAQSWGRRAGASPGKAPAMSNGSPGCPLRTFSRVGSTALAGCSGGPPSGSFGSCCISSVSGWCAVVALRQRLSTLPRKSSLVTAAVLLAPLIASLLGRSSEGSCFSFTRAGSATPSPNANTSPVPREGRKSSRFEAPSETAARTMAWSRSLVMRIANSVLHWEIMVASSSAGRWLTINAIRDRGIN